MRGPDFIRSCRTVFWPYLWMLLHWLPRTRLLLSFRRAIEWLLLTRAESRIRHTTHRRLCRRRMIRSSEWTVQSRRLRTSAIDAVELGAVLARLLHVLRLRCQWGQVTLT